MTEQGKDSAEREHLEVRAPRRLEWAYRDAYRHYGWSVENEDSGLGRTVAIRFGRDRSLGRRPGLLAMEAATGRALAALSSKERLRAGISRSLAMLAFLIGAFPLAGSMLVLLSEADLQLAAALGCLGLGAWRAGMVAHRCLRRRSNEYYAVSAAEQYAVIDELGERAEGILALAGAEAGR